MKCPNCNTELPEGVVFCTECGSRIVAAPAPQPEVSAAEPAAREAVPETAPEAPVTPPTPPAAPTGVTNNSVNATCPYCGAVLPMGAVVCPNCGGSIAYKSRPADGDASKNGYAVAGMVLGIISLLCCGNLLTAILGLIFGIKGRKSQKKGMATAGIVTSVIAIVLAVIFFIFCFVGAVLESASPIDILDTAAGLM